MQLSVLTVADVICETKERRRLLNWPVCQLLLGTLDELSSNLPAALQTKELGVSGLVGSQVLGCNLSELLGSLSHVEDIVNHLHNKQSFRLRKIPGTDPSLIPQPLP